MRMSSICTSNWPSSTTSRSQFSISSVVIMYESSDTRVIRGSWTTFPSSRTSTVYIDWPISMSAKSFLVWMNLMNG